MSKGEKIKILQYNAIFTPESGGGFSVSVPDLPGCFSQGDNFEDARKNITEAIELYLEDADKTLYHLTAEQSQKEFMAPISVHFNA